MNNRTHHNADRGPWLTPGIIDRLTEIHAEALPYRDVARILSREYNVRITRNAIIGKSHRLNLPHYEKRRLVIRKPRKPRKRVRVKSADVVVAPPTTMHCRVQLLELRDGICRFPLGPIEQRPPYLYCGNATELGFSYCGEHHARAYIVPRERWA